LINNGAAPITVLVANDHEWTARSLETILAAEGYRVERAFTARQARERAAALRPDAFVLDVQLPDLDGMSLCRALRSEAVLGHAVPIFLTTAGPSGRAERLEAYRAGAWEFFGQPLDGETLLLKLKVYLEAKAVVEELRRDSLLDEVTGLYSRRGLVRRGKELVSEAARRQRAVACLVIRPEAPTIEEAVATAEHLAREIGGVLRHSGRSADAIGRLGTLEFGVIAADAGETEVRQLVRRLNELVSESPLRDVLGVARFGFRAAIYAVPDASLETVDLELMLGKAVDAVRGAEVPVVVTPD